MPDSSIWLARAADVMLVYVFPLKIIITFLSVWYSTDKHYTQTTKTNNKFIVQVQT